MAKMFIEQGLTYYNRLINSFIVFFLLYIRRLFQMSR